MHKIVIALSIVLLAGCVTRAPTAPADSEVVPFSVNEPGAALPRAWQVRIISRAKASTQYRLVVDPLTPRVVLHAIAERSASGLHQRLSVDPTERPVIGWQWRVDALIDGADNTDRHAEDAPARLLLFFDGDATKLPVREQVMMDTVRMLTGHAVPYATLMYIWENRQPVDSLIASRLTSRVKMIVAASGSTQLGQWRSFERNYVDDFKRAFGETPRRLIGIGILTDADDTGTKAEAFYGDIELKATESAR